MDLDDLCGMMLLTHTDGGSLCLYEAGLVFDLNPGDIIFFASASLTHFNLDYRGWRVSVILHTDKAYKSWEKDCNGRGSYVQ